MRSHSNKITPTENLRIFHTVTFFRKSDQGFGNVLALKVVRFVGNRQVVVGNRGALYSHHPTGVDRGAVPRAQHFGRRTI
jgi:hypothetical protein